MTQGNSYAEVIHSYDTGISLSLYTRGNGVGMLPFRCLEVIRKCVDILKNR